MTANRNNYFEAFLNERFKNLTTLINANHNQSMDSIDSINLKFAKLNGTVADLQKESIKREKTVDDYYTTKKMVENHEKIINENIPQTILLCPQKEVINELKEWKIQKDMEEKTVIKNENIKTRNWTKVISLVGVIISFCGLLIAFINVTNKLEKKIDNLNHNIIQDNKTGTIGNYYNPFINDTIK